MIAETLNYDQQILQILAEAGERGIKIRSIVKHVYNRNASFFSVPDMQEIRACVRNFIARNTRSDNSLVEHTGRWGAYRLNVRRNAAARQAVIDMMGDKSEEAAENDPAPQADMSLDLFQ